MKPRHHRSERGIHNVGGLAIAKALDIDEVQNLTELDRQFGQRGHQVRRGNSG
jgi:hypothetical protein